MLTAYHDALNTMLNEFGELLPPAQREQYQPLVQRFAVKVLALLTNWSRS